MKVAILCANGLGDGLLMMIIAKNFSKRGHDITMFHEASHVLSPLFEGVSFKNYPAISSFEKEFSQFDLVLVENDHSEKAWTLIELRKNNRLSNITFLFPTPCKKAEDKRDFTFDMKKPVATNLLIASKRLLQYEDATKDTGICLPKNLTFRKYKKRVVMHPTSKDPKRNWTKEKFYRLATLLKSEGFTVTFALTKEEAQLFKEANEYGIEIPQFSNLKELAGYLFESGYLIGNDSGLGHLASSVGIPSLTISGNPKRVRLWRPDFSMNQVATLAFELPNFKGIGFRFRESYWQNFVGVRRVYKQFNQLRKAYDA